MTWSMRLPSVGEPLQLLIYLIHTCLCCSGAPPQCLTLIVVMHWLCQLESSVNWQRLDVDGGDDWLCV